MKEFSGKLAVVTGGGTGMGRELVRQLIAEGCDVATCDIIDENLAETLSICQAEAPQGVLVTGHRCDVANEEEVLRFCNEVEEQHGKDYVNLLFNNAGVGGGGSFVESTREEWERTFGICWNGVYFMCRHFLPLLMNSTEGHVVNTSSVNGFRASLGGNIPHTAYSAAKFAVKGFTEALINDFRFNAPHLKASIVMPGYVGTEIYVNSGRILGHKPAEEWSDEEVEKLRARLEQEGSEDAKLSNDEIREAWAKRRESYRDGGLTPAQAATIILNGVKADEWRILVGPDAEALDRAVRKHPLNTYDLDFDRFVREEWDS